MCTVMQESWDLSCGKDQEGRKVGIVKEGGEPAGNCECIVQAWAKQWDPKRAAAPVATLR